MGSNFVKVLAVVVVAVAIILDVTLHGHFDDGHIRDLIKDKVDTAPGLPTLYQPDVKVRDRTAYVSGAVDTIEERDRVTRAALQAPGILTLVNDVKVDQILEELLRRLKGVVEAEPTQGEFNYRVAADGHTVTLEGWVPKGEDDLRDSLGRIVEKVPGVRQVINNLSVGEPAAMAAQAEIYDILQLRNIYFDYNKATIRPESRESVKKIAGVFLKYPTIRVRIAGHTDSIASESYNQKLSEARAASVKSALVEYGVEAARIETIGYGETKPIAPNTTPEGRADNRRIEFKVLSGTAEPEAGGPTESGKTAAKKSAPAPEAPAPAAAPGEQGTKTK